MMLGRKTLTSRRARGRQIDIYFERTAQAFLLVTAFFVFATWLSHRPTFYVTELVIEGLQVIEPTQVERISGDALSSQFFSRIFRNNMLLYPRARVLREIMALDTRIAAVALSFDSRNSLRITVREYTPAALLCRGGDSNEVDIATTSTSIERVEQCYYADDRGYVFAHAPLWSGHPYVTFVSSGTEATLRTFILPGDEHVLVNQFLSSLSAIDLRPHTVTMLGNNDFRIETALSWDILWSSKKDPQKSTENLALVLNALKSKSEKDQQELETIDLRFGNKIFYK